MYGAGTVGAWKRIQLYLLLCSGAALFVSIILTAGSLKKPATSHNFFKNIDPRFSQASSETVNELLLSKDELSIAEKNSFINLYLKPSDFSASKNIPIAPAPASIYRQILDRKINNLKAKSNRTDDFIVKPVPK